MCWGWGRLVCQHSAPGYMHPRTHHMVTFAFFSSQPHRSGRWKFHQNWQICKLPSEPPPLKWSSCHGNGIQGHWPPCYGGGYLHCRVCGVWSETSFGMAGCWPQRGSETCSCECLQDWAQPGPGSWRAGGPVLCFASFWSLSWAKDSRLGSGRVSLSEKTSGSRYSGVGSIPSYFPVGSRK